MKYDVFISYSTKDKAIADVVCNTLENNGIHCWIAPRNIQPGKPYAREIINGIASSKALLLIYTSNSNSAEHVINEVDAAFNAKKTIIPFLVEDVTMNPELVYYLARKHWLVAYPDYKQKLGVLVDTICNILCIPKKVVVNDEDGVKEPVGENESNSDEPSSHFWDFFASSTFKVSFRYFVVLLIVVSVGVGAWSSFMVDNAPLESVPGKNYKEQVKDKHSHSNRPAPDEVRGHRPASSPEESDSNGVTPESRTLEEYSSCPTCFGSGIKYDVFNNMYMALPCPDCSGSGILPDKQFKEQEISVNKSFINGREYVDLDLPSGIKWATCNIGATKPEEYGSYYAWGETEEKLDFTQQYDFDTYKWYDASRDTIIKYGIKTVLDFEDDVACVIWGSGWRTPTIEEQRELLKYCSWHWTSINGVEGYKVIGKNGCSIFLPATGYRKGEELCCSGENGYYWSSSLDDRDSLFAGRLYISSVNRGCKGGGLRCFGYSVRPVSN